MNDDIKLSIIWGTVIVFVIGLLIAMTIITTAPRGDHGRLSCEVQDQNSYEVTITCATGPRT